MDKLKVMRHFCHIAETGSFSATARAFEMPVSSLSRSMQALEAELGAELLKRSTRHVSLTEIGELYRRQCVDILEAVSRTEGQVTSYHRAPSGLLRISAMPFFAEERLLPVLEDFQEAYPEITLDVDVTNEVTDFSQNDIDIAFRGGRLPDERVVAVRIDDNKHGLLASPGYLQRYGTPTCAADLVNHKAIFFRSSSRVLSWLKEQGGEWSAVDIEPVLISSNGYIVRSAILAGRGVGLSPLWCCTEELASGELVILSLPERIAITSDPSLGIYMLYYRPQYMVPKIQVAVDFFKDRLQQTPDS